MTKVEAEAGVLAILLTTEILIPYHPTLETYVPRDGSVWVQTRRGPADKPAANRYDGARVYIAGRHIYGEPTRNAVPIVSGYELISPTRDGYSFPHVGGPFKGRGWMKRLVATVEKHLATVEK